jgi:hypothetical protein
MAQYTNEWFVEQMVGQLRISRFSLATSAAAAVVFTVLVITAQNRARPTGTIDGQRFVTALADYARDCRKRGEPVPPTVTLSGLVRSGYLRQEVGEAFQGVKVVFHGDADETRPGSILVEATMPDGSLIAVLGDGGVQQLSPQRYKQQRKHDGQ